MRPVFFGLILACTLYCSSALAEPLSDAAFQRITESVYAPVIAAHNIPGMAVGVTYRGRSHIYTHGLAVRATKQPVTPETLFELGSVSKLFNVALAGLASQRGLFSLESTVSAVMPETGGSAFDAITLYDLAAHANGGLPLQVPSEILNDADLMEWLAEWLAEWNTEGDPKSTRGYSNISIGLLGRITGEAFGSDFETAVREELLLPLGLKNTYVTVPEAAMPRYAYGYDRHEDRPIRVNPGILDAEAYGLKSSVSDMIRFVDAHLGTLTVSPDLAAALSQTREARYDTAHYAQAMVWEEYSWPVTAAELAAGNSSEMALEPQPLRQRDAPLDGPMYLNKTGSTNGFGAYVAMVPAKEIGVVVLANRYYPNIVRAQAGRELMLKILETETLAGGGVTPDSTPR